MKTAIYEPPHRRDRVAWRREEAADEARWEAQLRRMPKHATRHNEPVADGPPASTHGVLEVAHGLTQFDTLLTPRTLPLFTGDEAGDFACGRCAVVIGSRTSLATVRDRHPDGERLLVRCTCGAWNVLFTPDDWSAPRNGLRPVPDSSISRRVAHRLRYRR
jgi:hypothetical protein